MPTQTETQHPARVPLSQLVWHPLLKDIPLMADIAAVAPRGAGVNDGDQNRANYLADGAADVGDVWQAFKQDVKAHLAESILVCRISGCKRIYVVDGRDRVSALRDAGVEDVAVEWVDEDQAERLIRSKTLRKHLSKGARAYLAATGHPELAEATPGNPSLKKNKKGSPEENAINIQCELGKSKLGRVTETRESLALAWGVSLTLIQQAFKVISLLEAERYTIAHDPSYKPNSTPEIWTAKIFAGWSLHGVITGLTGQSDAPASDQVNEPLENPHFLKLRAGVGALMARAAKYEDLTAPLRRQLEADSVERIREAHAANPGFVEMISRALSKAREAVA